MATHAAESGHLAVLGENIKAPRQNVTVMFSFGGDSIMRRVTAGEGVRRRFGCDFGLCIVLLSISPIGSSD